MKGNRIRLGMFVLELHFLQGGRAVSVDGPFSAQIHGDIGRWYCQINTGMITKHLGGINLLKIRYRYFEPMQGQASPIFEHEFERYGRAVVNLSYVATMASGVCFYPIKDVWPEMRQPDEYIIDFLPQFID